ncbi:hypothetical protein H257_07992 [Aphanomyces astaci]|uniref:Uncharacterized protein n=1 Tax=Aphanomyces astaci TaxID=112090 RepID=W4GHE0_APHAT|nr:hypothetical protein H257_07992 [Aphanomyces astaci]ETV78469.1 hypothetical protein H257_07992 [Aphanomyces astaci]|eukprot:XP_009832050.1 hypothetical protein H257_07992 [Aphanomyces astaci]
MARPVDLMTGNSTFNWQGRRIDPVNDAAVHGHSCRSKARRPSMTGRPYLVQYGRPPRVVHQVLALGGHHAGRDRWDHVEREYERPDSHACDVTGGMGILYELEHGGIDTHPVTDIMTWPSVVACWEYSKYLPRVAPWSA